MLREGSDHSYRPKTRTADSGKQTRRIDRSQRSARVDYTEVEILSDSDSEGTFENNEVEVLDIKSEREESVPLVDLEREENQWTTGTLARTSSQLSQQLGRVVNESGDKNMAREA